MFDGRHCVENDYRLLVNETNKILELLKSDIDPYQALLKYIEFIANFDEEIASKIRFHLNKDNPDKTKMIDVINRYIDELKQNVIVDIKEHR